MMAGQHDVEEYFDLIAECASKLLESRPVGEHKAVFWRKLVGKEWRNVYQHMTRPVEGGLMWRGEAYRRQLAMNFAALSRMAAMAAWDIGMNEVDGEEDPAVIATRFSEWGEQQAPKIR